jgi:hypothetical protein
VKARPILMRPRSVENLLAGRKTQTRRIVKPQPSAAAVDAGVIASGTKSNGAWWWLDSKDLMDASTVDEEFRCPYGVPGDLLWVREPHAYVEVQERTSAFRGEPPAWVFGLEYSDGTERHAMLEQPTKPRQTRERGEQGWRPARWMRREFSRLTLRLTDVRVERLNEISDHDCVAEGVGLNDLRLPGDTVLVAYRRIWEAMHGQFSWGDNPWVWALTFEVLRENVDAALRRLEAT